jgi:cation:H+ antiporter
MIWIQFVVCTALLVIAAGTLSRYGDVLAEKTGLGRTWMGAVVLAGATSLPELVSGTSAVAWLNAPNLADVRVVMLSSRTEDEVRQSARE